MRRQALCEETVGKDANSVSPRAGSAHFDPTTMLEAWDETSEIIDDRKVMDEIVTVLIVDAAQMASTGIHTSPAATSERLPSPSVARPSMTN